ncbi:MAG: hypothetical protein ACM3O6_15560 [Acidobacteriota bacterium]
MSRQRSRRAVGAAIGSAALTALIAAMLASQPALAQSAAPAPPPKGSTTDQKVERLGADLAGNVMSLTGASDVLLVVHAGCDSLAVFGLPVDKNCLPSAAVGSKTTAQRVDGGLQVFMQDASKSYLGKPSVTIEHLSCGAAKALGLAVSTSCVEDVIIVTSDTLAADPALLANPSGLAGAVGQALPKPAKSDAPVFDTAVTFVNDVMGLTPKGKAVKTCLDLVGDSLNLACESDVPTDVLVRSALDFLNPVTHTPLNPSTMGPPGSVSCVGGYCPAPLAGASTGSGSAFTASSNPFRGGSLVSGGGEVCRVGEVCPVTIADPNAPPAPHFADGTAAPKDWPNCDPHTGLCGAVIIQDGSLKPGSSSTVDGGAVHMSSVPGNPTADDVLEQTATPKMSSTLGPDCEANPYQSGCELPQATADLGTLLAAAPGAGSGGSWGGSTEVASRGVDRPIPGLGEGLTDEWGDGEED